MNPRTLAVWAVAGVLLGLCQHSPLQAGEGEPLQLVRIGDPVGGHIHPSFCRGKNGTLVVSFGRVNHRDLRVVSSTDGGKTWCVPEPFPHTVGKTYYPGSLTTLADGSIVHCWNRWSGDTVETEPRSVLYSISRDEGQSWSAPQPFPRNPEKMSVIRHPVVEWPGKGWLVSLSDQTLIFDPVRGVGEPFGDQRNHGLTPIVRTPKGTWVSGAGFRSTDDGASWQTIANCPDLKTQGWRHELVALSNGWLMASEILGPGVGGEKIRYVISQDDGVTWNKVYEYYNPGRAIGGRACPRTVELDKDSVGVVFYDVEPSQPGGPALWFLQIPLGQIAAGLKPR